jgi:membrane protease YdiL (CAAX protease family)
MIQICRPPTRGPEEAALENNNFQRVNVYPQPESIFSTEDPVSVFKLKTGNMAFKLSAWTFLALFVLVVFYPGISILAIDEDPGALLKSLNQGTLMFTLIATVLFQWAIFLGLYVSVYFEGTGLAGLGLGRIRMLDFAWAGAFFLSAWLVLTGLAWVLAQIGLPMPGEIGLLIPTDPFGRVVWVIVSFTAGFCEEIAFRGYLMSRLRLLGRFKTWVVPTVISAIAFGMCHAYQGWPGFIIITVYGVLFSLLYIRTGRLWPCIIAHTFQDLGALFVPQ